MTTRFQCTQELMIDSYRSISRNVRVGVIVVLLALTVALVSYLNLADGFSVSVAEAVTTSVHLVEVESWQFSSSSTW